MLYFPLQLADSPKKMKSELRKFDVRYLADITPLNLQTK